MKRIPLFCLSFDGTDWYREKRRALASICEQMVKTVDEMRAAPWVFPATSTYRIKIEKHDSYWLATVWAEEA